jgi:hypothetical protein
MPAATLHEEKRKGAARDEQLHSSWDRKKL